MELTTKQLSEFLGISLASLKVYKSNGRLTEKLAEQGYKIVSEEKRGRSISYVLEECESTISPTEQLCKNVFHTDPEVFPQYYVKRTECDDYGRCNPVSSRQLAAEVGVGRDTVSIWNKKLVDLGILVESGYVYYEIDKNTLEKREISKEEYTLYWKNKKSEDEYIYYEAEFKAGRLSAEAYDRLLSRKELENKVIANKACFRIKRYYLQQENELHQVAKRYFTEEDLRTKMIIPEGM